jgi:hypothetical protein
MSEPEKSIADILSPHTQRLLSALQWQGQKNDCGPFTTATVLNAMRGLAIEADKLARQMDRPRWRGPLFVIRRVPNWATFPWGMVDVFRENHLYAWWDLFTRPETLKQELPGDRVLMPVIGSYKPLWAHVMTLVAWDTTKGWGFANTQYPDHDIFWLDNATFQTQWNRLGRLLIRVRP